jgi:hypothetical protein
MKDYLLLLRGGDARMTEFSEKETADHMEKWNAYMGGLAQSKTLSGGLPLQQSGILLTSNGAKNEVVLSKDGEAVGGYLLIKAGSYDHAVELSKDCPIFEYNGSMEIREAMEMPTSN